MLSPFVLAAVLALQSGTDVPPLTLAPAPVPAWEVKTDVDAIGSRAEVELSHLAGGYRFSVSAFGRISWPFGALSDEEVFIVGNVILVPDHLRYSDVFEPGWGYGLEASVMFAQHGPSGPPYGGPGPVSGGLNAGVYISLQTDTYEGDNTSEGGAFFEPDDMTMMAAFIGMKVSTAMGGGAFGEAHVGIGMVRYETVDAEYSLVGPGRQRDEFLEDSQEFAFESRYRFSARLGPFALFGGIGMRILGSPEEADTPIGSIFDAHTFWAFDVDFGVQLGF
jgi:hypothetical protein